MATSTYTVDIVDDLDGLMRERQAERRQKTYDGDAFTGQWLEQCGDFGAARTFTITLGPGKWNSTEPVEVEGVFGSVEATGDDRPQLDEVFLPAEVLEGQRVTVRGTRPFMFPPGVVVTLPRQPAGCGKFELGVGDVVLPEGARPFEDVRATDDGALAVLYTNGRTDALWMRRGEKLGIAVQAVLAEGSDQGVTLYLR